MAFFTNSELPGDTSSDHPGRLDAAGGDTLPDVIGSQHGRAQLDDDLVGHGNARPRASAVGLGVHRGLNMFWCVGCGTGWIL